MDGPFVSRGRFGAFCTVNLRNRQNQVHSALEHNPRRFLYRQMEIFFVCEPTLMGKL